jgi:hypothetical protein
MAAPPAYLDECMTRAVAAAPRERGIDVLTAFEAGRDEDLDHAQLEYATSQGRVLVAYHRRDFR